MIADGGPEQAVPTSLHLIDEVDHRGGVRKQRGRSEPGQGSRPAHDAYAEQCIGRGPPQRFWPRPLEPCRDETHQPEGEQEPRCPASSSRVSTNHLSPFVHGALSTKAVQISEPPNPMHAKGENKGSQLGVSGCLAVN